MFGSIVNKTQLAVHFQLCNSYFSFSTVSDHRKIRTFLVCENVYSRLQYTITSTLAGLDGKVHGEQKWPSICVHCLARLVCVCVCGSSDPAGGTVTSQTSSGAVGTVEVGCPLWWKLRACGSLSPLGGGGGGWQGLPPPSLPLVPWGLQGLCGLHKPLPGNSLSSLQWSGPVRAPALGPCCSEGTRTAQDFLSSAP